MSAQNQNVQTKRNDIIKNFYRSGNFFAGDHLEELMKLSGLSKNTILCRLYSFRKRDLKAGKDVPQPKKKFSDEQIAILLEAFNENQYPTKRECELIGLNANLLVLQVENWFLNQKYRNKQKGKKGETPQSDGAHSPKTGDIWTTDQVKRYLDNWTKNGNPNQTITLTRPTGFEGENLLGYLKRIGGNRNVEVKFGTSEIGNNSSHADQLNYMAPEMVQTTPAFKDFSIESILAVPFVPKPQNN